MGKNKFELVRIQYMSGDEGMPTAAVIIKGPTAELSDAAVGVGPVDAAYKVINRILKVNPELVEFRIKSLGDGNTEAIGEALVRIEITGIRYAVIVASAKAYLGALNRFFAANSER